MVLSPPRHDALTGVRVVSPAPREVWREVLAADPDAVATQTPEWLDALCAHTGRTDASRLYETDTGRRLVLPLAARTVGGVRVAEESWPYAWGYGGALVDGGALRPDEAATVLADLHRRRRIRTTITPAPQVAASWEAAAGPAIQRIPYRSQVVDLTRGFDAVWARYSKSIRYSVRRAERHGVEVHRDTTGAFLPAFTELYRRSTERWAEQRGQPLPLARAIARLRDSPGQAAAVAEALGEKCVAWVASWHGEPVEVAFVLYHGATAHGWLAANDRRLVRETRGGALLKSVAIEDACARGMSDFLLGESEPGSPVEAYKRQLGATTLEHSALRWEPLPLTSAGARVRTTVRDVLGNRPSTVRRQAS